MIERRRKNRAGPKRGEGPWFRSAAWFGDSEGKYGPDARVKLPFSVPTLERGLVQLRNENLLSSSRHVIDPRTRRRLTGPRNFYRNRFGQLEVSVDVIDPETYGDELAAEDDGE
jgi:hypothetical protein